MKELWCPYCGHKLDVSYKELRGDEIPPGTFSPLGSLKVLIKIMDKVKKFGESALGKEERILLQSANDWYTIECPKCHNTYRYNIRTEAVTR